MPKKKKTSVSGPPAAGEKPQTAAEPAPDDPRALLVKRIVFFAVAAVGALSDVLSKKWVFWALKAEVIERDGFPSVSSPEVLRILGDTLTFKAAMNTGAVFSLFQGRWLFLVVFTVVALGIIGWVLFRSRRLPAPMAVGLGLVCAGALGNLWDRVLFSGVRDFIVFTSSLLEPVLPGGQWPTFNLADAWIVIGIPLILLGDFLAARGTAAPASKGAGEPSAGEKARE